MITDGFDNLPGHTGATHRQVVNILIGLEELTDFIISSVRSETDSPS